MEQEKFTLKNGKEVVIRPAAIEDASQMITFLKSVYEQSEYLTGYPDEVRLTLEQEEAWILKYDQKEQILVLAVDGDQIVGNVSVNALGNKDKVKHRCGLGITIEKSCWRQGLGRKLMQKAVDFAREAGYEQIELEVVSENHRAIPLYLSFGFEVYGTRPHAFKLRDGRYFSEYLMVKKL